MLLFVVDCYMCAIFVGFAFLLVLVCWYFVCLVFAFGILVLFGLGWDLLCFGC